MEKERTMKQYNVGVVGLGNRGYALLSSMMACSECKIVALSDLYEDRIEKASKLENGTRNPSVNLLKRLAEGMGMTLKIEFVPKK